MAVYKKVVWLVVLVGLINNAKAQQAQPVWTAAKQHWVDSVFNRLNKKQKIAQLFMVRAFSNHSKHYTDSVACVIKRQKLGGVVFFQGGPVRQAAIVNQYQKVAKVPLLIAMDGEWGLGMRLDSTVAYPYQLTLGAIQNDSLLYRMGQQVAAQFKRLGMQMNFAPDMDVNNNPNNPVIGFRSFGDNKYNVARKGIAYMQGMQAGGLLTTAKHFPGHGDTEVDSHLDLPRLPFTRARLDSLEMYPFRQAIAAGVNGIMVAHMNIPALDTATHVPSTLSKPIITRLLKDSLGFKGLVVSDAMEMKGVVKYFSKGEAEVRALIAGNDVIELSLDSKLAIKRVKQALRKGHINKDELYIQVKKVLAAKYDAGLNRLHAVDTTHLYADLNQIAYTSLSQQLSDASITLLKHQGNWNDYLHNPSTAIVSIGTADTTVFQREMLKLCPGAKLINLPKAAKATTIDSVQKALTGVQQLFIGVHDMRLRPASKLDFSPEVKIVLTQLATRPNAVCAVFANPYTLAMLPGIEQCPNLLLGYQKGGNMQLSAIKVISGQLIPNGKLPVSVNVFFANGAGL